MLSQTLKSIGHIKCSSFSNYLNLSNRNFTFHTDCLHPLDFSHKNFIITNIPDIDHTSNYSSKKDIFLQNIESDFIRSDELIF
mgnify:CR=1 FL=1